MTEESLIQYKVVKSTPVLYARQEEFVLKSTAKEAPGKRLFQFGLLNV